MQARDSTTIWSTTLSSSRLSCCGVPSATARSILRRIPARSSPVTISGVVSQAASSSAVRAASARTSWSSSASRWAQVDPGQPSSLKGPQVPVDGRTPFLEGGPGAGQFGLAARVLVVPGLLGALGGRFEDEAVIQRRQGLGQDRVLQGSGGKALLVAAGGAVSLV